LSVLLIAVAWVIAERLAGAVQIVAAGALAVVTLALLWRWFLRGEERQALRKRILDLWPRRQAGEPGDRDARGV
jgi:hypothetical protein